MSSEEKKLNVKAGVRTINVDYLARVEGEGAMYIKTKDDRVEDVHLKIFEPPRFFEAFLQGRELGEAPDITARICGICPIAYQTSSINAMEYALGISVPDNIQIARRLIYCGEWIESHTLHVFMLHAPDFFGCADVIEMAKNHKDIVGKALRLKKAGNQIIRVMGGRSVHPINMRVGGFYQLPTKEEVKALIEPLKQAREDALEAVKWVSTFDFPDLNRSYECVSLSHPDEYPMARGGVAATSGLRINVDQYDEHFEEEHVERSTALHSIMKGKGAYLTGPIARYNLCGKQLSPLVQEVIKEIGFEKVCSNPFRSIVVRALETLYACDEAIRIMDLYEEGPSYVQAEPKNAVGYGASEAPRGLLYHRYRVNERGLIEEARIIPPTAQSQKCIEEDLRDFVVQNMKMPDDQLVWHCEQAIRNYDPCISCSVHFLKLHRINE